MEEDQMPPDPRITVARAPEGGYHVVSEDGAELVSDVPARAGVRQRETMLVT